MLKRKMVREKIVLIRDLVKVFYNSNFSSYIEMIYYGKFNYI